ncbi:MAG: hypothetical protein BAW33_00120 [Desulfobacterales bacterium C00003104]|nr:MAG: hypothetical protein BAW33_00120 [Desulfobacterales bacterium C00003104]
MESKYETPIWFARYTYKGLYPLFGLYTFQDQAIYPSLIKAADGSTYAYAEKIAASGLTIDVPFIRMDRRFSLTLGYQYLKRAFIEESRNYEEKTIISTDASEKDEGTVWTRLSYFDGTVFRRSNSVEDGRLICVTTEKADPCLGGSLSRWRTLADWSEYVRNPRVKNHVLKLAGTYGFGHGDRTAQGMFGLGGFGDIISAKSPGMQRSITIRGYEANYQTGTRVAKLSSAYRFPIAGIWKGAGSAPFFAKQVFAEVFYEAGRTWDNEGKGDDLGWLHATGLECNFSMKLLRYMDFAPGLGVVYAPDRPKGGDDDDERWQFYISIKGSVNF